MEGRKSRAGSSAYRRASIAWPRNTISFCVSGSVSPAATRNCHSTRSRPVIDLRHRMLDLQPRVHLHEVKTAVLDDELDGAGADIADRARRRDGRLAHRGAERVRSCPAPALPRSPSGGGAGSSSRARTGARRCRACRRTPGFRYGAGVAGNVRSARGRRRTHWRPRAARRRARRQRLPRDSTTRMPLPPPPADALISTGIADAPDFGVQCRRILRRRRDSRGPAARRPAAMSALAADLTPMARIADGGGPTNTQPARAHASAKSAFSERKP